MKVKLLTDFEFAVWINDDDPDDLPPIDRALTYAAHELSEREFGRIYMLRDGVTATVLPTCSGEVEGRMNTSTLMRGARS